MWQPPPWGPAGARAGLAQPQACLSGSTPGLEVSAWPIWGTCVGGGLGNERFLLRIPRGSGPGGWGRGAAPSAALRPWPEARKVGQSRQVGWGCVGPWGVGPRPDGGAWGTTGERGGRPADTGAGRRGEGHPPRGPGGPTGGARVPGVGPRPSEGPSGVQELRGSDIRPQSLTHQPGQPGGCALVAGSSLPLRGPCARGLPRPAARSPPLSAGPVARRPCAALGQKGTQPPAPGRPFHAVGPALPGGGGHQGPAWPGKHLLGRWSR